MGERDFPGQATIERWHSEMDGWFDPPETVTKEWLASRAVERAADCLRLTAAVFKMQIYGPDPSYKRMRLSMYEAQKQWKARLETFEIDHDLRFWMTYGDIDLENYDELSPEELFLDGLDELRIYVSELWSIRQRPTFRLIPRSVRKMLNSLLLCAGAEARAMGMEWMEEGKPRKASPA